MKKTKLQKVTALALALVLLLCGGLMPAGASDTTGDESTAAGIGAMLNAISYDDYIALYNDKYERDEDGEILYDDDGEPILNENYVPLADQTITIPGTHAIVSDDINRDLITLNEYAAMLDYELTSAELAKVDWQKTMLKELTK